MSAPTDDRFCDECGVSRDLHYGEDDCESAELRAGVVEQFGHAIMGQPRR